jgi:S-formylglutathione hydrolase FrmB
MKAHLRRIALATALALIPLASCHRAARAPDTPRQFPGVTSQDVTFYAPSLARNVTYRVYLPAIRGAQKLPVVYLLHGGGGDYRDWSLDSSAGQYAAQGFILVMPDGALSYWVNAAMAPKDRYGDFLTSDLIHDVEERFSAIPDRSGRAIVGISMGGYAAVRLALTRPELFAFAGAISPAIHVPTMRFSWRRFWQSVRLRRVFGPDGSPTRQAGDVFQELNSADPGATPYLYITAGTRDPMVDQIRRLSTALDPRGFHHELRILPGGHDWHEWNAQIPGCFSKLIETINK